jgi:RNA-binding protein 25
MKAKEIAAKISNNMITSTSSSSAANRVDSEKHRQKQLVDKIPTDKDALFAYEVDWILADRLGIVLKEMKPWIHKKVLEYLGEEEKTLISFIETKLMKHCSPSDLLNELAPVLDEDAEQFVVKLWRMLIFSILKHSSC